MAGNRSRITRTVRKGGAEPAAPAKGSAETAASAEQPAWWKKQKKWLIATLTTGVTTGVITVVSGLVIGGAAKIPSATGLVHSPPRASTPAAVTNSAGPVSWTVAFDGSILNQCHTWTFRKPLTDLPVPNDSTDFTGMDTWAVDHSGVDNDSAAFDITVQGTTDEAVVIRNLRVVILSKKAPFNGTYISDGGCGAYADVQYYDVDLTSANPTLYQPQMLVNGTLSPESTSPAAQYTVTDSDPEVFDIDAEESANDSTHYDMTFAYEFDWSQGASTGTVEVLAPGGRPFELDYPANGNTYVGGQGKWVLYPS